MPKGNPNSDNVNNFVVKVYDNKAGEFKPIYQPPEATARIRGISYLSDAVDSEDDAETGVTSATPLAVKTVNDNANTKLSKTDTTAQTVAGTVTFSNAITVGNGITGNLKGNVTGNADTASKLRNVRNITIKNGDASGYTAQFDGSADATITVSQLDASTITTGTLPMSVIPASAQERVVTVLDEAGRLALTKDQVQVGDTVYQSDTNTMYMVVDDDDLGTASGYQEYSAGTASRLGTVDVGASDQPFYLAKGVPTVLSVTAKENQPVTASSGHLVPIDSTIGAGNRGVYLNGGVLTAMAHTVDSDVPATAVFDDMVGSTADTAGVRGLVPAPDATEDVTFLTNSGTWSTVAKAETASKLSNTLELSGDVLTDATTLDTTDPVNVPVTIATGAVTRSKMADSVKTVYVGQKEPDPAKFGIWIQSDTTYDEASQN